MTADVGREILDERKARMRPETVTAIDTVGDFPLTPQQSFRRPWGEKRQKNQWSG